MSAKVRSSHRMIQSPLGEVWIDRGVRLWCEGRFVEAGRQQIDQVDIAGKFAVLFSGDAGRNEYAKMPGAFVNRINDRLLIGPDLVDILVKIENPAQSLLRRGDVVAL